MTPNYNTNYNKLQIMSWKDSKIFIAVSSSVATTLFLVTVIFTGVIPTWIQSYQNENAELKKQLNSDRRLSEQLKNKDAEIASLRADLDAIRLEKMFEGSFPYPLGLDRVRIGDRTDKIKKLYPAATVEKDAESECNYEVKSVEHALFGSIVYACSVRGHVEVVKSVRYRFKKPGQEAYEITKRKLVEHMPTIEFTETKRRHSPESRAHIGDYRIDIAHTGMWVFQKSR